MSDYVTRAESVIKSLSRNMKSKKKNINLTTTQLRKFLAMANEIDNKIKLCELRGEIKNDTLPESLKNDILAMKVKLVYQSGREKNVKEFVQKSDIMKDIDNINGKASNFTAFFNYLEALVAYRKFEGDDK